MNGKEHDGHYYGALEGTPITIGIAGKVIGIMWALAVVAIIELGCLAMAISMISSMRTRITAVEQCISVLRNGEDYVMASLAQAKWMNDDVHAVNAGFTSEGKTNDLIQPLYFPYRGRNIEAGFAPNGMVFVRDVGPNGLVETK